MWHRVGPKVLKGFVLKKTALCATKLLSLAKRGT